MPSKKRKDAPKGSDGVDTTPLSPPTPVARRTSTRRTKGVAPKPFDGIESQPMEGACCEEEDSNEPKEEPKEESEEASEEASKEAFEEESEEEVVVEYF